MPRPSVSETSCRKFSLHEIKSATNNFSTNLIIGEGSFGIVYRAKIAIQGKTTTVAVKRRNSDSKQGSNEFWTEVELLSQSRHTHLISLIGYCDYQDAKEMILVYEYMPNGTLADHIYKKKRNSSDLCWEQRLKICIGVGRGLEYLHTGTGSNQIVVHHDLKSSNILIDADWAAKISDVGLCKKYFSNHADTPISASVKGTPGYMDPHYRKTKELSTKTDVYAFGVVLLEVLCGKRSLDFAVAGRPKKLLPWAPQCIRDGYVDRVIDRSLKGRIADDGLRIFQDITLQCLQERPNKRPAMVEVVAKLEAALALQNPQYSSSDEDDFIKVYFGQVDCSSSSNSDAGSLRHAVESGSGKSDNVKQFPSSESNLTTVPRNFVKSKSFSENKALGFAAADVQSNQVEAGVSTNSSMMSGISNSLSEYDKLTMRMHLPSAVVDNESCENATVIKVYSTSTPGVLLELLQVLTDFHLKITKASRDSDGLWFMDVFFVIDQEGNKVTDKDRIQNLQKVLLVYSSPTSPMGRKCEERSIPAGHTTIELIGNDRPGLISELTAILSDLQCNVVSAEVWTHNTRLAAVMHVSDKETKSPIIVPEKLSKIKKVLLIVLKGGRDNREAVITFSYGCTWFDRRLHQIMFADRYYQDGLTLDDYRRRKADIVSWADNGYSAIRIRCKITPKVLFDTICTLTDLKYCVFQSNFFADGPEAYMEFWIKHLDGSPFKSDTETQKVIKYLETAIERRVYKGLKIEIRTKDRVGLLSDVTRIMRENSLNITRAEVATTGDKAVFAFYLDDNLGYPVSMKIIEDVKKEIGENILHVKGKRTDSYQSTQEALTRSSFKEVLKTFLGWVGLAEHQVFSLLK
uniref:uncharacterized protein LOC122584787 n=1 Tax=Erigeron canadensis TaxID=72917 RepID=UPI001CB90364|nr:uncharacterized protein LOC122584787 [Erigeron canadensis]